MADSNLLKRGDPRPFDDNDPFAELTRIMGREPQPAGEAFSDDDDFGIDLEKEMLGDLDAPVASADPEISRGATVSPAQDHPAETEVAPVESTAEADPAGEVGLSEATFGDLHATDFAELDWQDDAPDPTLTDSPRYETPAADWQPEPVAESADPVIGAHDGTGDLGLADVDMDFGELDFSEDDETAEVEEAPIETPSAYEPVPTAHAAERELPEWEPAIEEEPSLEDELGMLLSGDGAQPAEPLGEAGEDWRYEETPETDLEVIPHISLGRANYAPADENHQAEQLNTQAADAAEADIRWSDEPAWDEPSASEWEPEEESDPLPESQPDPFAVFSTIAPQAVDAQPAVAAPQPFEAADDMDTVEIAEAAAPLQDDLDLPEPDMGDQPPAMFDDYDAEFAQVFGDMGDTAAVPAEADSRDAPEAEEDLFAETVDFGVPANGAAGVEYPPSWHNAGQHYADFEHGRVDAEALEREIDVATYGSTVAAPAARRRNNGMLVAGAVLAVAIVGGLGAFALSFGGGSGDDAPAVVQADGEPLKVKPENPGGTTVPNQDSQAYERVAGNAAAAGASQERLVTTAEEPVNLAARVQPESAAADNALPGVDEDLTDLDAADGGVAGKSEERIEAQQPEVAGIGASEDLAAVQPRRVRTMIVRPDGTLVPREDPAPSAPTPSAVGPIASQPQESLLQPVPPSGTQQASAAAVETIAQPAAQAIREVSTQLQATPAAAPAEPAPAVAAAASTDTTPASGPIVPERPVETQRSQPQAQQQQVAQAAAPARTQPAAPQPPAAAGEWSMQIASQPTADGAQATYQDLARRYGGIIGGHGVNIVRADIPGKGTYYRVRIPSDTRAEAISLCEKYKAAGGSCFVSK